MKHLRETFTDEEFAKLSSRKGDLNWHDYLLSLPELKSWEDATFQYVEEMMNRLGLNSKEGKAVGLIFKFLNDNRSIHHLVPNKSWVK